MEEKEKIIRVNHIQVQESDSEDSDKLKVIELPDYLVTEHIREKNGDIVSIMNLKLDNLIFEKLYLLFEKLRKGENALETAKIELEIQKNKLLLETDFKKELNESRPTIAMKEAYMKPLLSKYEDKVDKEQSNVTFYKDKLQIINDLIRKERLLLEIEGDLKH